MRLMFIAALATPALLAAYSAQAQDEGTPPAGDVLELAPDAPRGILGDDHPENQERHQALLLQNFLAMDLNGDHLLAESEWQVWSGWRGLPPPAFEMVDVNATAYLSYREYEDAALTGDGRLSDAMHGAVFPEEEVAE